MAAMQVLRDRFAYYLGYAKGWSSSAMPRSISELYGIVVAKTTSFISLPLPLISFLAIPFVGGSSTTVNLVVGLVR
jgi:hypothetical protein